MKLEVLVIAGLLAVSTNGAPSPEPDAIGEGGYYGIPKRVTKAASDAFSKAIGVAEGTLETAKAEAAAAADAVIEWEEESASGGLPYPWDLVLGSPGKDGSGFDMGRLCNSLKNFDFHQFDVLRKEFEGLKKKLSSEDVSKLLSTSLKEAVDGFLKALTKFHHKAGIKPSARLLKSLNNLADHFLHIIIPSKNYIDKWLKQAGPDTGAWIEWGKAPETVGRWTKDLGANLPWKGSGSGKGGPGADKVTPPKSKGIKSTISGFFSHIAGYIPGFGKKKDGKVPDVPAPGHQGHHGHKPGPGKPSPGKPGAGKPKQHGSSMIGGGKTEPNLSTSIIAISPGGEVIEYDGPDAEGGYFGGGLYEGYLNGGKPDIVVRYPLPGSSASSTSSASATSNANGGSSSSADSAASASNTAAANSANLENAGSSASANSNAYSEATSADGSGIGPLYLGGAGSPGIVNGYDSTGGSSGGGVYTIYPNGGSSGTSGNNAYDSSSGGSSVLGGLFSLFPGSGGGAGTGGGYDSVSGGSSGGSAGGLYNLEGSAGNPVIDSGFDTSGGISGIGAGGLISSTGSSANAGSSASSGSGFGYDASAANAATSASANSNLYGAGSTANADSSAFASSGSGGGLGLGGAGIIEGYSANSGSSAGANSDLYTPYTGDGGAFTNIPGTGSNGGYSYDSFPAKGSSSASGSSSSTAGSLDNVEFGSGGGQGAGGYNNMNGAWPGSYVGRYPGFRRRHGRRPYSGAAANSAGNASSGGYTGFNTASGSGSALGTSTGFNSYPGGRIGAGFTNTGSSDGGGIGGYQNFGPGNGKARLNW